MIDRVNLVFGDDGMMPLAITFAPYLTLTLTETLILILTSVVNLNVNVVPLFVQQPKLEISPRPAALRAGAALGGGCGAVLQHEHALAAHAAPAARGAAQQ